MPETPNETDAKRWTQLHKMLAPERPTAIIDIGANPVEPSPYDLLLTQGLAQVYCFEPQPSAYEALLAENRPNRIVLPYAVGDGTESTLHICRHSGFTSLLPPNPAAIAYLEKWAGMMTVTEQVQVQTVRLDDIAEIPHADLIKIDIQGGEAAVFRNGPDKLHDALMVFTEVAAIPLYVGQPLMHEQMRLLSDAGFYLHKFDTLKAVNVARRFSPFLQAKYHQNQLVDGDAIFIRSLLDLQSLTVEQLKHLAILSDAVIQSYDLALAVLDLLITKDCIGSEADVMEYCAMLPANRPRRLRQAQASEGAKTLL
ncbi:FkbM family methyltransferase [Loktanella sp. PT4BL]|jgi:FkbM family methyltransferase|uniref:FkbM family methyltransferase n=1 Tax=Loktanella sp. PT4BL TaxID=2135611 RepID=UPI000D76DA46|nr:FkbM family methyltransferase [Loktanella sp. PT4BL]PXW68558.1 FkbM family methyltransferase [Loktanella sp. PT4BL]